jgi:hypothetical protein
MPKRDDHDEQRRPENEKRRTPEKEKNNPIPDDATKGKKARTRYIRSPTSKDNHPR